MQDQRKKNAQLWYFSAESETIQWQSLLLVQTSHLQVTAVPVHAAQVGNPEMEHPQAGGYSLVE